MAGKSKILSVRIVGEAKSAVQSIKQTESAISKFGGFAKKAGLAIGGLAVAGGAALTALGVSGLRSAADLEQSAGAVETVFKQNSDKMKGFAENAAKTAGLTKNEYNEMATLIGTQLKVGGTSMDELADKTNNLLGLSADLSSMFGGSSADAAAAISSALKGERDPIERYGISLKQATIDAKAAELGFQKVGGSLSDQAQQAATLALIYEQSTDAQGNFAREINTASGQAAIASAQWGNFQAQIGEFLLPLWTAFLSLVTGTVMPAMKSLVDLVGPKISAALQGVMPYIQQFGEWLGALLQPGGEISSWAQQFAPVLSDMGAQFQDFGSVIAAAAAAALPNLIAAVQNLAPIVQNIATNVFPAWINALKTVIPIVIRVASNILPGLSEGLGIIASVLLPLVTDLLTFGTELYSFLAPVFDVLSSFAGLMLKVFGGAIAAAIFVVGGTIKAFGTLVVLTFKAIFAVGKALISFFVDVLPGAAAGAYSAIEDFFKGVRASGGKFLEGVKSIAVGAYNAVGDFFNGVGALGGRLLEGVKSIASGAANALGEMGSQIANGLRSLGEGIGNFVSSARAAFGRWVSGTIEAAGRWVSGVRERLAAMSANVGTALAGIAARVLAAGSKITALFRQAWSSALQATISAAGRMVSYVAGLPRRIVSGLGNLGRLLFSAGGDIIGGLVNGIKSKAGAALNAIRDVGAGIKNRFKSMLGINSPSRVFAQYGQWTGQGLVQGLEKMAAPSRQAMEKLVSVPSPVRIPLGYTARPAAPGVPYAAAPVKVEINFNGLVSDRVAVAREIKKALEDYYRLTGEQLEVVTAA